MQKNKATRIQGMFIIVDRGNLEGLEHWAEELEMRGIPAVIQIEEYTIDENCNTVKGLSNRLFEFGCAYNEQPLWNESFYNQYEIMSRVKDKLEACMNRPMRVFQSKYLAYNEATLQVADKLGIEFILARGTAGARAVVYKPHEYNAKIISVSNVPSKEMGSGSLCDFSLWSRTETPAGFRDILFGLKEDRIVLVAQAHLSGVKSHWWNVYQDFLNANIVTWKSLDEFGAGAVAMPNAQIPINTAVDYTTPKPRIPLEQEPDLIKKSV